MTTPNLRVLVATAPKNSKAKYNASNSNLSFWIRKRLIATAKQLTNDAYNLVNSNKIIANFNLEIKKLRLEVMRGGL